MHCAGWAVVSYARLMGQEVSPEQARTLFKKYEKRDVSLKEIADDAATWGLKVTGLMMPFEDLCNLDRPVIAHLQRPQGGHFVTVERATAQWVRVVDMGLMEVIPAEEFQRVFSKRVLVPHNLASAASSRSGQVSLAPYVRDLGRVYVPGETAQAFTLTNNGAAPLTVREFRLPAYCHTCLQAPVVLQPGQSQSLAVTCTLEAPRIAICAPVQVHIGICSDDRHRPLAYVTMKAEVCSAVRVTPSAVNLGEVRARQVKDKTWHVSVQCAPDVRINGLESDRPDIYVSLSPFRSESGERTLVLWLDPGVRHGPLAAEVRLYTSLSQEPTARIAVSGTIVGELYSVPSSLFFGFSKPGACRTMRVYARDGRDFTISSVDSEGHVSLTHRRLRGLRGYEIEAAIPGGTPAGILEGTVTVTADIGGPERLEIPFYAHVVP